MTFPSVLLGHIITRIESAPWIVQNMLFPVRLDIICTLSLLAITLLIRLKLRRNSHSTTSIWGRATTNSSGLMTGREVEKHFPENSWQIQSFEAFRSRILLDDPLVFPCIYATKGFKAQEHLYCFINAIDPSTSESCLRQISDALREYAIRCANLGPMTSIVILTPLPSRSFSLSEYRSMYWNVLRGIADRDTMPWPKRIPETVSSPDWQFCFHGESFVSLAMAPSYERRQSRYCASFAIAMQPLNVFLKLDSTPGKMEKAMRTVRDLTDMFDDVEYSPDVIAVGAGDGVMSMSRMFFIADDNQPWPCPWDCIRSE